MLYNQTGYIDFDYALTFQSLYCKSTEKGQSRVIEYFERVQINLQASMSPGQHRNVHTFNTAGDFDQLLDIDFQPALPRIKPAFQCTQLDILLYSSKQLMHYEHITPKTHIRHFSVVTGRQSRRHRTRENHKSSQGLFLAML